jgi:hypothetical protein
MPRQDNTVVLEDVELIFRNFAGRPGMYNAEGERNFAVVLPQDVAEALARDGWNIKLRKSQDEDEPGQPYISVRVYFGKYPPMIKMITYRDGERRTVDLDESNVEILDLVDIAQVDLIIRPNDWAVGGKTGRKAYLQSLYVTIIENPLELKYGGAMPATVDGPMMERTEVMHVEER